jgi:PmbA protein
VAKALTIARYTAEDDCAGLADPALLARAWRDLDLYHPWELSVDEAIALGRECEAAALGVDRRLINSEGATVSLHEAQFVYANTNGFSGGYSSSRHGIYCAVIGEEDGAMQRDDWYATARSPADLEAVGDVGRQAGLRTARRLGARQLATMDCPVLYEAPIATGLIGHFVSAVSGGSLYRKSSFLVDSLGTQVLTPAITTREEPRLEAGPGVGAVRRRRSRNAAARRRARRGRARLFPGQLLGAQARSHIHRQRRRQSQSGRQSRRR